MHQEYQDLFWPPWQKSVFYKRHFLKLPPRCNPWVNLNQQAATIASSGRSRERWNVSLGYTFWSQNNQNRVLQNIQSQTFINRPSVCRPKTNETVVTARKIKYFFLIIVKISKILERRTFQLLNICDATVLLNVNILNNI